MGLLLQVSITPPAEKRKKNTNQQLLLVKLSNPKLELKEQQIKQATKVEIDCIIDRYLLKIKGILYFYTSCL